MLILKAVAPQGTPRVKGGLRMVIALATEVWTRVLSTKVFLKPRRDFLLSDELLLEDIFKTASWVVILSKEERGFLRTLESSWVGQGFSLTLRSSTHRVLLKSEEAVLSSRLTPVLFPLDRKKTCPYSMQDVGGVTRAVSLAGL